jgi:hypothetical protein
LKPNGGGHYEEKRRKRDEVRTQELKELGVVILRFNDREILTNIEGVYEIIKEALDKAKAGPLTSVLSPGGRGSFAKSMEVDCTANVDVEK